MLVRRFLSGLFSLALMMAIFGAATAMTVYGGQGADRFSCPEGYAFRFAPESAERGR